MNTIRVLIYRDLRRFWIAATCLFAIFILAAFISRYFTGVGMPDFIGSATTSYIIVGMVGMPAMYIVLDTPLCGTASFWMTRPISGVQLFASKLAVVVVLCVLLPTLMLAFAQVFGVTVSLYSHHISLMMNLRIFFIIALVSMSFASVSENQLQWVAFLFLSFIVAFLLMGFLMDFAKPHPETRQVLQYPVALGRISAGTFHVGIISILFYQYVRRNRKVAITAFVILILLFFALQYFWPTITVPRVK